MYQLGSKEFWKGRIDAEDGESGKRWHQIINFLNLSETPLHKSGGEINIAFLGFCCDEGVRRNKGRIGAQAGPDALRQQMASLPVHFSMEEVALFDAGNIICPNQDMERAQELLGQKVNQLLTYGFFPIVLGGGHEVAYGHYLGLHAYTKANNIKELGIINLDAHFDLRSYTNGTSSGTPFRQIVDLRKNHNLPFRYLCLGIQEQGNTQALFRYAKQTGTEYLLAEEIKEMQGLSLESYISNWLVDKEAIYLTLDLDVLAAAYAPGVSAINPLGVKPELVNNVIKYIIKSKKLLSLDIAELNPQFDIDGQTAKLSAWTIFSIVNSLIYKA